MTRNAKRFLGFFLLALLGSLAIVPLGLLVGFGVGALRASLAPHGSPTTIHYVEVPASSRHIPISELPGESP
ncbi:MAG TPA: hypothetical protein VGI10_23295 [Polyangiaceae bacterium]|jgi:hypothetical protein